MKLGGIAATKFTNKNLAGNSYAGETEGIYRNSDQVREHYLRQIEQQNAPTSNDGPFSSTNQHASSKLPSTNTTPMFWEERQKIRQLEAEGFRNQATASKSDGLSNTANVVKEIAEPNHVGNSTTNANLALVKIATFALEQMADALEASKEDSHARQQTIPMEDRAAFAQAIQRAMQAMAP